MSSVFETLGLQPNFLRAIEALGFDQPTPIQLAAIPVLLQGRDVVGQAQTGTGKTAAFMLPMLQNIQPFNGQVQGLVLAPTRELAIQVAEAAGRMAAGTPARILPVYGGQSYTIQIRALKRGVDIVVGTPGRLLDLMRQGKLDLSQVRFLVLDEADEMLEMGFIEDVEAILAQAPATRQMALFSATMPKEVVTLAEKYQDDPEKISINPTRRTVAETEQRAVKVRFEHKPAALVRLLEAEEVRSGLIFARTKAGAQELADLLIERGYPAEALHGDLSQARREFVLNRFRQHAISILVATDVAARGLDIEDVSHVINYDIPEDVEDYVHRIGRTGRAGRKGMAITFVTPRDRTRLKQIETFIRQSLRELPVPTPDEIQQRRDARFINLISNELGLGELEAERRLVEQLAAAGRNPIEIAAAAIRLARQGEGALPVEEIPAVTEEPRFTRRAREEQPAKPGRRSPGVDFPRWGRHAQEQGMVRLRMNLGDAHGLRPSDVVGAIASEVGIPGKAIGEIDIRRTHTFLDVSEQHVRQVLKASDGKYFLRGKPVQLKLAK